MKTCTSCGVSQDETKFKSRAGRQAGQRFSMCNRCLYVLYTRPNAEKKLAEVQRIKLQRGCADCGYNKHPAALEFDHRPGEVKSFNIGEKVGTYSMARIMEEIAKCDVVCANCHAIRTAERRSRVGLADALSDGSPAAR